MTPQERAFVRLTQAVERVAQAVEHQAAPFNERISLPDLGLRPGAVDRKPLMITPNSAIPLQVQCQVYDAENSRRYLRVVLLDGYGSAVWQTSLQTSTMAELRSAGIAI